MTPSRLLVITVATLVISMSVLAGGEITGAGASYPLPIYTQWGKAFYQETGIRLEYQATGSSEGLKQILAKSVDFGATDAELSAEELEQYGLVQFPMVMGAIVPVVNLIGIEPGELKLTGNILAEMYLGNITMWNDVAIKKLNPDLKLPRQQVYLVHRSEGSGTTYHFTRYLARNSAAWQEMVGFGMTVAWPRVAQSIGREGNAGIARVVQQTPGALGYVEFAYAMGNSMIYTQLNNQQGDFVSPTPEATQAALAKMDGFGSPAAQNSPGQPGSASWPITVATFILMHRQQDNAETANSVLSFFDWSYRYGDPLAEKLHYVPLPENLKAWVRKQWAELIVGPEGDAVYPDNQQE